MGLLDTLTNLISKITDKRFVVIPLFYEKKDMSKPGEIVQDISLGRFYTVDLDIDNNLVLVSESKKNMEKLEEMFAAGIVAKSVAYHNNIDNITIYKKGGKIYLDHSYRVAKTFRYYSIHNIDATNGHGTLPITGRKNVDTGVIENSLIDILHDPADADIWQSGICQIGDLHSPAEVIHGHDYKIKFYDTERNEISSLICRCSETYSTSFLQAPEYNIDHLVITTNRDVDGEDLFQLMQYQDPSILVIRTYAHYQNGDYRDISSETVGSKLQYLWNRVLDTSVDPLSPGAEYQLTARYFIQHDPLDPNSTISIDATKLCKIIPDIYKRVKHMVIVPKLRKFIHEGQLEHEIRLHIFAIYEDNTMLEITNNSRVNTANFDPQLIGASMTFNVELGLGSGNETYTEDFQLLMSDEGDFIIEYIDGIDRSENSTNSSNMIICYDNASMRMSMVNGSPAINNMLQFKSHGTVTLENATIEEPTHYRIRSINDPGFYYTPVAVPITDSIIPYSDTEVSGIRLHSGANEGVPVPVLVEYLKLVNPGDVSEGYKVLTARAFQTKPFVIVIT